MTSELKSADRQAEPPVQRKGLGVISAHEAYPLALFQRLTGLGGWAYRNAKRNGLKVRKQGRSKFVLGSDWLNYLDSVEIDNDNG